MPWGEKTVPFAVGSASPARRDVHHVGVALARARRHRQRASRDVAAPVVALAVRLGVRRVDRPGATLPRRRLVVEQHPRPVGLEERLHRPRRPQAGQAQREAVRAWPSGPGPGPPSGPGGAGHLRRHRRRRRLFLVHPGRPWLLCVSGRQAVAASDTSRPSTVRRPPAPSKVRAAPEAGPPAGPLRAAPKEPKEPKEPARGADAPPGALPGERRPGVRHHPWREHRPSRSHPPNRGAPRRRTALRGTYPSAVLAFRC